MEICCIMSRGKYRLIHKIITSKSSFPYTYKREVFCRSVVFSKGMGPSNDDTAKNKYSDPNSFWFFRLLPLSPNDHIHPEVGGQKTHVCMFVCGRRSYSLIQKQGRVKMGEIYLERQKEYLVYTCKTNLS